MQRNFMNFNEVYPILDLIGRVQNRKKGNVNFYDVGKGESGAGSVSFRLPVDLRVVKLDVVRDNNNPVMTGVIVKLLIEYENGAKAELDIHRGLEPKVSGSVQDSDFINYVMITGLTMVTVYEGSKETMELTILKEGGYGTLLGIEVRWDGKLEEVIKIGEDGEEIPPFEPDDSDEEFEEEILDEPDYDTGYDNPNDFFNNGEDKQEDVVQGYVEEVIEP